MTTESFRERARQEIIAERAVIALEGCSEPSTGVVPQCRIVELPRASIQQQINALRAQVLALPDKDPRRANLVRLHNALCEQRGAEIKRSAEQPSSAEVANGVYVRCGRAR